MKFSLMFFASSEQGTGADKYALILEAARFADRHDFHSLWVPERHFNPFGHLYPNPSVLQAAVARETTRLGLRAGSVVLPLHNPIRVVEEWAMVDNLSAGRVGVSFAPGWNPDDFAFFPDHYERRYELLYAGIDQVRALWAGTPAQARSGRGGEVALELYPRPLQRELPIWITAAGTPASFSQAGERNAHLLTHLLDQGIEKLAEHIALYRQARERAGHDRGQVTLMLHSFVGQDLAQVHRLVRAPYCAYLKRNLGLLRGLAYSRGQAVDLDTLAPSDLDQLVGFLYDRFAAERGLIGTPESCLPLLRDLAAIGVDEVACLLDFGPADALVLEHLPHLEQLARRFAAEPIANAIPASPLPARASAAPAPDRLAELKRLCPQPLPPPSGISPADAALIQPLYGGPSQALALLRAPAADPSWILDPAHFELCNQLFLAASPASFEARQRQAPFVPVGVRRLRRFAPLPPVVWGYARLRERGETYEADLELLSETGQLLVSLEGLSFRQLGGERLTDPCASLCYELTWQNHPLNASPTDAGGDWLILCDHRGLGERLAAALSARGGQAWLVTYGEHCDHLAETRFQVRPGESADLSRVLEHLPRPLHGAVFLWGLDCDPDPADASAFERAQRLGCLGLLALTRALERSRLPLYIVTEQAQALVGDTGAVAYTQSALWGFGRAALAEFGTGGGLIDLASELGTDEAAQLLAAELTSGDGEDQIAYRGGRRHVARLARAAVPAGQGSLRSDATYLLSGGLGDLGLVLARGLVAAGARHLLLLARTGADAQDPRARERRQAISELEDQGCQVRVVRADVGDAQALAQAVTDYRAQGGPAIDGVFHLAAAVSGAALQHMDASAFDIAYRAKARGAWNLHRQFADHPLTYFVCYSALPGLLGQAGLGAANYAAANAFLDGLAEARVRQGLPGASWVWGPWQAVGLAARAGGLELLAEQGLDAIDLAQGQAVLLRLLAAPRVTTAIAHLDWQRFATAFPNAAKSPFLSLLAAPAQVAAPVGAQLAAIRAAAAEARAGLLERYLLEQLAMVRARDFAPEDRETAFTDLGLDSLALIALRNRIVADFGCELPIILFFDQASVARLAQALAPLVAGAADAAQPNEDDEWVEGEL